MPLAGSAANSQLPNSSVELPPKPASIQFSANSLSIRADNSSLKQILAEISAQTGMEVQGLANDQRVFGSFGPGKPQDVLTDLLNGAYDFAMVGTLSSGAPRELVLSSASQAGPTAAVPAPPPERDQEDDADTNPDQQPEQNPRRADQPISPTTGVKSPQQLFQELQRMREQQQQQNPPANSQNQAPNQTSNPGQNPNQQQPAPQQ